MGKPTTIIRLNTYIKPNPNDPWLYPQIKAAFCPHQRHFFLCLMALNTETHNWVKYRELGINCRIMESKGCISITTPPYALLPMGIIVEEVGRQIAIARSGR